MTLAFCCRPIGLQRVICDLVTEQQPMCMQRVEGTQAGWAESTVVSVISREPGFRVLFKQLRSTHSLLICLLYWTLSPVAGCPE